MFNLLIGAAELQAGIQTGQWLIFDVRHDLKDHQAGRRAYEQGHIPGAIYLDHESRLSAPKTGRNGRHPLPEFADFAALMQACGLTAASKVAIYDADTGMFAAHLWWMLRWLGHEQVAVLDGGWRAWLAGGGPVQSGTNDEKAIEAQSVRGMGAAGGPAMPVVDADGVLANLHKPVFTVIDARAGNRYAGEVEPMDPVAGHIPGALNRPNTLNLQADGHFKAPAVLRAEFDALLEGRPANQIVHQCGSGITACHNLFSMELAGLKGSALYPGSWSEWCSDASRPVARGSA
ncbi:sulfurtransferase [Paralcaligenes sp. KSB-10]|uniref:sulfurtransferase n=1 Tax=Paralcaligenes sp. KSB-10 TaxID=2901142 RepID=UPI001E49AFBA|nr:sulfurtransferase [Paralcaligenes sp. KSB-10]UHL65908.1 sulfurtransferase [Paralcaligenes sp. KSB-10]